MVVLLSALLALPTFVPPKTGLLSVQPASESVLELHFRDGYVVHHKIGEKRSEEQVVLADPLDVNLATELQNVLVSSTDDPDYKTPQPPKAIHRKSKGTDFAWFTDEWVNDHFVNHRADYAAEHWIYVNLSTPLKPGHHYRVSFKKSCTKTQVSPEALTVVFDPATSLSNSIHVNRIGYRPDAPLKFAYVYAWMGDGGGLDVRSLVGRKFKVVDQATNQSVLEGKVAFRKPADNSETNQIAETPKGNFLGADVAECDFSSLDAPGKYFVSVAGVGRSPAFSINKDVFRTPFRAVMQGILGQRSGISLNPPTVPFTRPAPHNPLVTPGFAHRLKYTKTRYLDWKNEDHDDTDKAAIEAGILGDIDSSGWYQDAGDWDSYSSHLMVPQYLMVAYLASPKNFRAAELNLPDKNSSLPDILKEARWLPRFCFRLRHELMDKKYGSGGLGLRICGDHFGSDTGPKDVGIPSWQDVGRTWIASGEDPVSTFGYAGVAAELAICLDRAGLKDPENIDWRKEAVESYAWAIKNTRSGDESKPFFKAYRILASAALDLITSDPQYRKQLDADTSHFDKSTTLWFEDLGGPALYALVSGANKQSPLATRLKNAVLNTANTELQTADRRACRWGGNPGMPMLIGQQTTPWVVASMVASKILKDSDPKLSNRFFGLVCTTADYFLGTNPLNMVWISGVTESSPKNIFQLDAWYESGPEPRTGIVPYGPWRMDSKEGKGPWDHDWANKSAYPEIDQWPGAERWFDSRCCPMTNEYTIHQNLAPAAAVYGFLCDSLYGNADSRRRTPNR